MVRERQKLWGFDMGGDRYSGIAGDDESLQERKKPKKLKVTKVKPLRYRRPEDTVAIINPLR